MKTLIYPYRILDSGCFKSMDTECQLRVPEAKKARYKINFSLCIICQVDTSEPLVENPSAHEKLLTYISDCATYVDANMKTLYDAASVLRKALNNTEKWDSLAHLQMSLKNICQRMYSVSFVGWCKAQIPLSHLTRNPLLSTSVP